MRRRASCSPFSGAAAATAACCAACCAGKTRVNAPLNACHAHATGNPASLARCSAAVPHRQLRFQRLQRGPRLRAVLDAAVPVVRLLVRLQLPLAVQRPGRGRGKLRAVGAAQRCVGRDGRHERLRACDGRMLHASAEAQRAAAQLGGCAFWLQPLCRATRLVAIGEERVALARLHDAGGDELAQRRPALPRPFAALFARGGACAAFRPCAARARRLALLHRRRPSRAVLRRPLRLALRQPERDGRSAWPAASDLHAPRTTPPGRRGTASACAPRAPCPQAAQAREPPPKGKRALRLRMQRATSAAKANARGVRTSCGSAGTSAPPATSVSAAAGGCASGGALRAAPAAASARHGSPTTQRR